MTGDRGQKAEVVVDGGKLQGVLGDDRKLGCQLAEEPLRAAEISVISPGSRSAVLALLDAQQGPYRPAAAVAVAGGGSRSMIALQFDAPASLNMSQP